MYKRQVLLQTHHPDHPLLHTLINGGYHAFADEELALRDAAALPPYAHLAVLRAEAKHVEAPTRFLGEAKRLLEEVSGGDAGTLQLHGPLPAPMPRRAGFQRMQLVISAAQRKTLHQVLASAMPAIRALPDARKLRWSLDVDATDLY